MPRNLIIIVSLSVALVWGIGLVWPKYQDLKSLRAKIKEKNIELQQEEGYFLELQKISQNFQQYSEALSKIDSALPLDPSIPALFGFLQKRAAQSGLVLKDINFTSTPSNKELQEVKGIKIILSLSGSYSAFKDFLLSLEKSSRLIEIKNISFTSPSEKEKTFTFNLSIVTYSY